MRNLAVIPNFIHNNATVEVDISRSESASRCTLSVRTLRSEGKEVHVCVLESTYFATSTQATPSTDA
jgi:hypothetical protein